MKPSRYDLDPEGDLVLIVEASTTPDFVWYNDTLSMDIVERFWKKSKKKKKKKSKAMEETVVVAQVTAESLIAHDTPADKVLHATAPLMHFAEELPAEESQAEVLQVEGLPILPAEERPHEKPETEEPQPAAAHVNGVAIEGIRDIESPDKTSPSSTEGGAVDALPREPKRPEPNQDCSQPVLAFGEGPLGQFRIRVSSRHLCLASPVFKTMLEGLRAESTPHDLSLRELQIRSWSIDALIIVLDIIHGHHRDVPKRLSLQLLAQVSMIVGYYQCQEVTQVFGESWAKIVEIWLPNEHGMESTLMLIISWVFSRVDTFEKMSQLALKSSEGQIAAPDLYVPIPEQILVKIEQQRIWALGRIFETLYALLDSPDDANPGCSFECSSMMLGSLLIELKENYLQNPRVKTPYGGYSILRVKNLISNFRNPEWSRSSSDCGLQCTVQAKLQPTLDQVSQHIEQLKLWGYGQERKL